MDEEMEEEVEIEINVNDVGGDEMDTMDEANMPLKPVFPALSATQMTVCRKSTKSVCRG